MQASTGRKALLFVFLFCATLIALPTVLGQQDLNDLGRDSTMRGDPNTPTGDVISDIFVKIVWLSVAVFLLVSIVLVYILVRFRHRRGEKREVPQIHGNSKLEIAWTIGPALVMVYLLVISYDGLLAIDNPDEEPAFSVQVVGQQFLWTFTYPDGAVEQSGLSTLRVQEDTWVRLQVTSNDVIHAFAVPGLDIMIDANPGRTNVIQFYAEEPGVYLTQCRNFCGTGHGEMLAAVEVFPAGTQDVPYGRPPREAPPTPDPNEQPDNATGNDTEEEVDRVIEVSGFEYGFDPAPLRDIEPGERVRVVFRNDGQIPHNLFMGSYTDKEPVCTDPADEATCLRTDYAIPGGGSDSFVFTAPAEPIAYDVWCDISGHADSGMLTYASVGGAEPEGVPGPQPRLPGPGIALTLVGLFVGAVVWARRR